MTIYLDKTLEKKSSSSALFFEDDTVCIYRGMSEGSPMASIRLTFASFMVVVGAQDSAKLKESSDPGGLALNILLSALTGPALREILENARAYAREEGRGEAQAKIRHALGIFSI